MHLVITFLNEIPVLMGAFREIKTNWNLPLDLPLILSACKESSVRLPGASGFCYRASEFCF